MRWRTSRAGRTIRWFALALAAVLATAGVALGQEFSNLKIDPTASLSPGGQILTVTGTVTCEPEYAGFDGLRVTVIQGKNLLTAARGFGFTEVECPWSSTSTVVEWTATVVASGEGGGLPFKTGRASALAELESGICCDGGDQRLLTDRIIRIVRAQ